MPYEPSKPAPTPAELVEQFADDLLARVYANIVAGDQGLDEPLTDLPPERQSLLGQLDGVERGLQDLVATLEGMPPEAVAWFATRLIEQVQSGLALAVALHRVRLQVTQGAKDVANAGSAWHRWRWGV